MIPAIQSISRHAVERYADRVSARAQPYHARVAILRMWQCGHYATDRELKHMGKVREGEATYRITETSAGRFLIIMKRGIIVTLWEVS